MDGIYDIVLLMLGTNDAREGNWNETAYRKDMKAMVKAFKNTKGKPKVYVMIPPPIFQSTANHSGIIDSHRNQVVNFELPRVIRETHAEMDDDVGLISMFEIFGG